MRIKRARLAIALVAALGIWTGCAHARHVAVVADASLAAAVFAVDDAESVACQARVLSAAQCADLNAPILKALRDVRALTVALQATPAAGTIPTSLTALVADLALVSRILSDLAQAPDLAPLVAAATAAQAKVAAQLTSITGGR